MQTNYQHPFKECGPTAIVDYCANGTLATLALSECVIALRLGHLSPGRTDSVSEKVDRLFKTHLEECEAALYGAVMAPDSLVEEHLRVECIHEHLRRQNSELQMMMEGGE